MIKTRTIVMTGAAVLIAAAGCGSSGSSQSAPTTGTADTSAANAGGDAVPGPGVPKVPNPISNTKTGLSNPCSGLTSSQLRDQLGEVPKPEEDAHSPSGPRCQWNVPGGGPIIAINWYTPNKRGLTDIYSQKSQQKTFDPVTIDGYPAVAATDEGSGKQGCEALVGVTDQLVVGVDVFIGRDKVGKLDPCKDAAEPVAKLVLGNIKKQGS